MADAEKHPRLNSRELTGFTRELSWLVNAGLPAGEALNVLARDGQLRPVARLLGQRLRAGGSIADALLSLPDAFPADYVRMVAVAEQSGSLGPVLERIAAARQRLDTTRRRVGTALIYPAFLGFVAIIAIVVILLVVVPQLKPVLAGLQSGDAAMEVLISASDWLAANGLAAILLLALAALFLSGLGRLAPVRLALGRLGYRLPVIGTILAESALARVTRTLVMLLESGLGLPEALALAARTLPEGPVQADFIALERTLRQGGDLASAPLRRLPAGFLSLLRIGMETGSLTTALGHAATVFEEQGAERLERGLLLIEPVIIATSALVVGGLAFTLINALMSVNGAVL